MRGGFSGPSGIILYDTDKEGKNAVFGYLEGEKMVIKVGPFEKLNNIRLENNKQYDRKDKADYKVMLILAVMIFALIIISFACTSFLQGLILTGVLIAAYIPVLGICFANMNMYESDEIRMQFRRYHGSEHKALRVITKEKEVSIESLRTMSVYDSECGTVYMGYFLVLLSVIAVLTLLSVSLLKALGIVIITIVLLVLNLYNPYNPFIFLQKNAVLEPTEREYVLVYEMLKKYKEL